MAAVSRGHKRHPMTDNLIGVTGATGELEGSSAARLAERGVAQRLVVRDPSRAPELPGAEVARASSYADGEEMRRALKGVRTLFLVSAGDAFERVKLTPPRWTRRSRPGSNASRTCRF